MPAQPMAGLVVEVSPVVAVLGGFLLSFFFVASLYTWKLAGYVDANRDEPGTIQRRFLSALLSCACSAALLVALARRVDGGLTVAELLGLGLDGTVRACVCCLALTAALFVGPLVQHWAAVWKGFADVASLPPGGPWVAARNYVLAPISEEFVFRACLVRLWLGADFPRAAIILVSPLCFGLAHAHHFMEQVRRGQDKVTAAQTTAFQVCYTWLFGMFCNFLLLRTGSTLAVILTHAFCNHQGFPDLGFLASRRHCLYEQRFIIGTLYLVGIALFCWLIGPITDGFDSTFVAPRALVER